MAGFYFSRGEVYQARSFSIVWDVNKKEFLLSWIHNIKSFTSKHDKIIRGYYIIDCTLNQLKVKEEILFTYFT